MITIYYNVILAHVLIYFCYGFTSPMPWAGWNDKFEYTSCDPVTTSRAEAFYNIYVLKYYDETCKDFDETDPTTFSLPSFFATVAVWFICFLCASKGVKSISQIIWFTVPLPFVFLMILIIGAATLEGSIDGVKKYITGEGL